MASLSLRKSTASGRLRLHAKCQLVAGDARLEFALQPRLRVGAVQLREEIELGALLRVGDAFGRSQIRDRLAARLDPRALVKRRHEARAPVARAVDHRGALSCMTTNDGRFWFSVPSP